VVEVSPEECRNSTEETKRNLGGWALKGACCNDCECERCEGTAEAEVPIPPPLDPW